MTDRSIGSAAWVLSPGEYIAGREASRAGPPLRSSCYVTARDGTRLAADVYLPLDASAQVPAVLLLTPYYRRFAFAPGARPGTDTAPGLAQYRDFFTQYGYAVVAVDTRGTGASFGARTGMRSPEERLDYHDVVDWVSRQPWCNGAMVPDHTTLSRCGQAFARRQPRVRASGGPVHLVLDSTGLELFGQGEWCAAKHGRTRRRWMKLHLGVDATTGEVVAHVLTDGHVDDAAQVPDLLRQSEGDIASLTADGAYDGEPVYQAANARQPGRPRDVIIPPRSSAVPSTADPDGQSPRDRHIQFIIEHGRMTRSAGSAMVGPPFARSVSRPSRVFVH